MKNYPNQLLTYLLALAMAAILPSCEGLNFADNDPRRHLDVEELAVRVILSSADTAAVPQGTYRALLFNETGVRSGEGFIGSSGGVLSLPVGHTSMMFHTFGTESARVKNDLAIGTAVVALPQASSHKALYEAALGRARAENEQDRDSLDIAAERQVLKGYEVVWEPDAMWMATASADVPRRIVGDEEFVVSASMRPLVTETYVSLSGVGGATNISAATAYVTGVGSAVDVRSGAVGTPAATQFSMLRHDDGLMGRFHSFGPVDGADMKLLVVLTDVAGGLWLYAYDLSGDDLSGDISLTSAMDVPEPKAEPSGGFLPVIEDWNSITIPVKL